MILRPTRKLRALLPPTPKLEAVSDTALGDWYVNRIIVDRRPLLLLVSAATLLPLLLPARDVRALPARLGVLIAARLRRLGVAEDLIAREVAAMEPVVIAPTQDRSVLGIMVDFAKSVPDYLEAGSWDETTLPAAEAFLADTPCHAGRPSKQVVWPDQAAPARLRARWGN